MKDWLVFAAQLVFAGTLFAGMLLGMAGMALGILFIVDSTFFGEAVLSKPFLDAIFWLLERLSIL